MAYKIDLKKIQKGDIILERGDIRLQERFGNKYTHAILCLSDTSCIESEGMGVNSINPQRKIYENEDDIIVLRLKTEIPNQAYIIYNAIQKARSLVGTSYDPKELRRVKEKKPNDFKANRQFCSRLITQSYSYGGLDIVKDVNYPELDEIAESEYLEIIESPLIKASDKDIEYANSASGLETQRNTTFHLLEEARRISGVDIQTMEQIIDYLVEGRADVDKFDEEFSIIFENSDYYKLWEIDCNKHPENYDYEIFKQYYNTKENIYSAVMYLLSTYKDLQEVYSMNYATYISLFKEYGFKYFELEMFLYDKLVEVNHIRLNVAKRAIAEFNLDVQFN